MIQKKSFSDAIAANIGVVEGLVTPNIFGWGYLDNVDANTLRQTGFYAFAGHVQNVKAWSIMFVAASYDGKYVLQVNTSLATEWLKIRACLVDDWSVWTEVTLK